MSNILSSKKFHTIFGWTVSIVLLTWISLQVEWEIVLKELVHLNLWYLFPITVFWLLHYVFRAYRWRYLLPEGKEVSIRILFDSLMIGNMATFVLPLRAGEFIRPYVLAKRSQHSFATGFSSIVIERFFDLSVVLLMLASVSPFIPDLPEWAIKGASILALIGGAIFLFMLVGAFFPKKILRLNEFFLTPLPDGIKTKLHSFLAGLLEGTSVLRSAKRLMMTIVTSFLVWGSCMLSFHFGLFMFEGEWTYLMSLTLTVVVALAVAAPSAPGFLGVFQTACVAALGLFGVSKETAFAYSLIFHAYQYLCVCLYGIYALSVQHLSLKTLNERTTNSLS